MNIFIAGLGLIGGSMARAISERTSHTVFGYDKSEDVCREALDCGAIAKIASPSDISECDIVIICLYPAATIDFAEKNIGYFKKGAILTDTCGIKTEVCTALEKLTENKDITFVGGHPMAGIERSGFSHSFASLFDGASMILCPSKCISEPPEILKKLFLDIGFGRITLSTKEHHDKVIAFTSQLAHLVSSAYVQGEYATEHSGFSAGSYKDMTRVARLNADMWTELFFENRENLSAVCGELVANLEKFKTALDKNDRDGVHKMLACGNERKIISDSL